MLAASTAPSHLDPVRLFLDADIVVQAVILGLLLASIWVWTIIAAFLLRMSRVNCDSDAYERAFWKSEDLAALQDEKGRDVPLPAVAEAGPADEPLDPCVGSHGLLVCPPNQLSPAASSPVVSFAISTAPAARSCSTMVAS